MGGRGWGWGRDVKGKGCSGFAGRVGGASHLGSGGGGHARGWALAGIRGGGGEAGLRGVRVGGVGGI